MTEYQRTMTPSDDAALCVLWDMMTHYYYRDRFLILGRLLGRNPMAVRAAARRLGLEDQIEVIRAAQADVVRAAGQAGNHYISDSGA